MKVSNCCGTEPIGELFEEYGRCSDCCEMAEFVENEVKL